jgi:hypothetical protein
MNRQHAAAPAPSNLPTTWLTDALLGGDSLVRSGPDDWRLLRADLPVPAEMVRILFLWQQMPSTSHALVPRGDRLALAPLEDSQTWDLAPRTCATCQHCAPSNPLRGWCSVVSSSVPMTGPCAAPSGDRWEAWTMETASV